ncbi:hypothetical protein BYT27DRAFT_7191972 [Phlegmacium glaucopus]|nr:hypothetical protein BYT27DRAFT_7191972 [Phlegmacium glaucopus]
MARKWYVVIVGKDIGVFPNWVEAGPLVKGVSDAVHQSFRSEEEARRVFSLAFSKGDTRIVQVGDRCNGATSATSARSTPSGGTSNNSYPNGSFSTVSSIPTKTLSPNSTKSFKPGSSPDLRPVSYNLLEPVHNSTHPTTSDRLCNNNKKSTEIVPVETRVFKDTRILTPQSDPTGLSPSLKQPSRRPRAIVKTPSWLASYPKSPQPLSPLDSEYLSLNNFRKGALNASDQEINFKPSPLANSGSSSGSSVYHTRTPRMSTISPQSNESVSDSSILFSPPVRRVHVVHEQDKDPRSPLLSQVKVPLSGLNFMNLKHTVLVYFSIPVGARCKKKFVDIS